MSDVIRALDFAVANRARFNLRVINLSIGAAVLESYETDPLALAARRAVEAGLVVVAAAGNFGKNDDGEIQYGGITAPGNAPWVLTVGAYSTFGTPDPSDDRVAGYSSRGPTAVDFNAKPDILAPGTRIVSLNDHESYLSTQLSCGSRRRRSRRRVPVLHAERHQHGGACGDRPRRPHAAGESRISRRTRSRRFCSTPRTFSPTPTSCRRAAGSPMWTARSRLRASS